MSSSGSPDSGWFQIATTVIMGLMGAALAWVQFQIAALRRDDERAETRAVEAVKGLREEFNRRHDDHIAVQQRQHEDNRAEMAALRSLAQSNADAAALERRRMLDSLEKVNTRLGEMADRKEVTALIVAMKQ